jgi:hypothetical protein
VPLFNGGPVINQIIVVQIEVKSQLLSGGAWNALQVVSKVSLQMLRLKGINVVLHARVSLFKFARRSVGVGIYRTGRGVQ